MAETKIIQFFNRQHGFAKTNDLLKAGITFYQLKKMLDEGYVRQIKRGLYRLEKPGFDDEILEVSKMVPQGVFCLFSAWAYHGLSDIVPAAYHLAVEKSVKIKLPDYPPIKMYYWGRPYFEIGIIEIMANGVPMKMYSMEKSVCDAVRFRNKIGKDTEKEVLKNYLQLKNRNINELLRYAKLLRVEKVLKNYLNILT